MTIDGIIAESGFSDDEARALNQAGSSLLYRTSFYMR
jgi:hypothetical protein